jgi:hypothetical protein
MVAVPAIRKITLQEKHDIIQQVEANPNAVLVQMLT